MQTIYNDGHEIQDHTTRHDYKCATHVDTLDDGEDVWIEYTFATLAEWDSLCERSLFILDSLGISVKGWNQPGGAGVGTIPDKPTWKWLGAVNDSLYDLIAKRYTYIVGSGVYRNTAHLNLRGHNYPDRFPLFNVPHRTIDEVPIEDIKREIADAVAAGLWYPAVAHTRDYDISSKVTQLIEWIDECDIPVLRVDEACERVLYGHPDPLENQFPQARMLTDLDGNGKPDGFMGDCLLDTLTACPVDSAFCMKVFGEIEFYCYGPQVGVSSFSIWAKGNLGSRIRISYQILDFDWLALSSYVGSWIETDTVWTKIDSTSDYMFNIVVGDEADRIRFLLYVDGDDTVSICYPELYLQAKAGLRRWEHEVLVYPNPVWRGESIIVPWDDFLVLDVMGRVVGSGLRRGDLETRGLAPGVYLIYRRGSNERIKLVLIE